MTETDVVEAIVSLEATMEEGMTLLHGHADWLLIATGLLVVACFTLVGMLFSAGGRVR